MATIQLVLVEQQCIRCGCWFGIDRYLDEELHKSHNTFYCPNGHSQFYTALSEAEKWKAKYEAEQTRRVAAQDQAQAAERSKAAIQGHLTKAKRRIANGVCPECNRHFQNVERHMKSQHAALIEEAKPA